MAQAAESADSFEAPSLVQQHREVDAIRAEVARVIVGQRALVDRLLIALLTNNHALIEGVPGLAKTLTVSTLARAIECSFARIQFTPDLLPADVTGTLVFNPQDGQFRVRRGPVFANIVLADEINRAPAKVQSALLEAMQERTVSIGGESLPLPSPFLVLATQNPIEQEGTYPLPEAQLDRFIFKLVVGYSQLDDLMTILDRTTGQETPEPARVLDGPRILEAQDLIRGVIVAPHVKEYASRLVLATHPGGKYAAGGESGPTNRYIRCGASPRAAQALLLGGKVKAVTDGRYHVSYADIKSIAHQSLRHRLILNFEAEADRVDPDDIVTQIMDLTPTEPVAVPAMKA